MKISPKAKIGKNVTFSEMSWDNSGDIEVKDGAFIGDGSIILPGVTIGVGAVVESGSVVNKNVPEGVLVRGNPAKQIRSVKNEKKV